MEHNLIDKVRRMSEYLDDEAIARALKLTPESVRDILEGKAEIIQQDIPDQNAPVIHVSSVKTTYRQKIISVMRSKGGVGCSVIALGLAYLLSKEIKVLLIDLNFNTGGGDLSYYLNLQEYPHSGILKDSLQPCVIRVEPQFDVLQAPKTNMDKNKVDEIINLARQDYDAVVLDLPNKNDDTFVKKTLWLSNTLVAVTSGIEMELARLAIALRELHHKDIIVVVNKNPIHQEIRDIFVDRKIIRIENDYSLDKVFEKCDLPGMKCVFMRGVREIVDVLFERQHEGILTSIWREFSHF